MSSDDLISLYGRHLKRRKSAAETTVSERERALRQADRELPFGLDAAAETEIEDWIWREGIAPSSRASSYDSVVGFYRWATHAGLLVLDPTTELERPAVPEGLPRVAEDEQVAFLTTRAPQPYRLWGILGAYGGLRCVDISRLEREHITPERIHVVKSKRAKTRFVPMHPVIWQAVEDLPEGPVTDRSPRQISTNFFRYCQRRGMSSMSHHRLRGWYATRSYRHSKDLMAVKANMGHSHPNTTARYIELNEEQLHAVIDGLPTFD